MQQPDNYQRFDRSTSLEKANLVGGLFGLIPAIALFVGHLLYNGEFTLTFNPNDWFGIILREFWIRKLRLGILEASTPSNQGGFHR
ncbi:MAG: hypothetical protein KatS3mg056_1321 [Chloroflexus sp.]|nr:MAG: hypothetical protein KatS3mg056_1321 [Chloroflexus sp.]